MCFWYLLEHWHDQDLVIFLPNFACFLQIVNGWLSYSYRALSSSKQKRRWVGFTKCIFLNFLAVIEDLTISQSLWYIVVFPNYPPDKSQESHIISNAQIWVFNGKAILYVICRLTIAINNPWRPCFDIRIYWNHFMCVAKSHDWQIHKIKVEFLVSQLQ